LGVGRASEGKAGDRSSFHPAQQGAVVIRLSEKIISVMVTTCGEV
jgi:hypothetical protein